MTAPTVHVVLADLLTERADQLTALAHRLRAAADDSLPPHRILALAGDLLAQLADLEIAMYHLAGWLDTP